MDISHQIDQSLSNQIELVPVKDLKPYKQNSRTHSDHQVTKIMTSITEFGFTNPILVDEKNRIIAGHGRMMAAQKLGLNEVPVLRLPYLSELQKKAYVIADNKIALDAGWDLSLLNSEIQKLVDEGVAIELTGFSSDELESLMKSIEPKETKDTGTELDLESFDGFQHECPKCGFEWNDNGTT